MELHHPHGQEPHPMWHGAYNTFRGNDIDAGNTTEIDRAVVLILDVVLCGFSGDLQVTFRQANLPYFLLRSARAD